jgi:predicted metal-dependent hydrolase
MSQIILAGKKIEYAIKESRKASRMRLSVYPGGAITVTVPVGMRFSLMERFMKMKSRWILSKIKIMEKKNFNPFFQRYSKKEYLKLKPEALGLVKTKIKEFNEIYKFEFNKISIRNSRSRWGSCSSKKKLSFNYKIIFLPEKLQDYVIIHELCHTKELNHSNRFWGLVAQIIPDYKKMRKEIRNI